MVELLEEPFARDPFDVADVQLPFVFACALVLFACEAFPIACPTLSLSLFALPPSSSGGP